MRVTGRAPLRLGLAGGGTDLSPFCDLCGAHVLNITIGLYAYTIIEPLPDDVVERRAIDIGMNTAIRTIWTLPVSPLLALNSHRDSYEWLRRGTLHWPENCKMAGMS